MKQIDAFQLKYSIKKGDTTVPSVKFVFIAYDKYVYLCNDYHFN